MKFLFFAFLFLLASCKPAAVTQGSGFTFNRPGGAPILPSTGTSFTLISPSSTPNFLSTLTFSVNGVVEGETVKIYSDANCSSVVASAVASGTTVNFTRNSLSVGIYRFYTNSTNSNGTSKCSSSSLLYNYLGPAATLASSLSLFSPASSPDTDSTPTFLLTGVVVGETIKIFSDSACTVLMGSAVAAGTTVQVTSKPIAPSTVTYYTATTNSVSTSSCSSFSTSYQYLGVAPTTASSIVLTNPSVTPNYLSTPTFTVSGGVAPGDTVKLYNDAGCTTLIGSAVAADINVSITTSAFAVGLKSIYTKSTNIISTSACSGALTTYNYLGTSPSIQVSWTANRETAVNKAGGGYKVYYSTSPGVNISTAAFVDVPYVAGPTSPTTVTIGNLLVGTYYFKVVAYSALNIVGGSGGSASAPSAEFSLAIP